MFKRKVKTDKPIHVQIGDVRFQILRIGARYVDLGMDAPDHMQIVFLDGDEDQPAPDDAV